MSDTTSPLKIGSEQTIRTADELRTRMVEHLDRRRAVEVDLSEVEECDAAGVQLIYALFHTAAQRRQPFRITAVSAAIAEIAGDLGLRMEDLSTPGEGA